MRKVIVATVASMLVLVGIDDYRTRQANARLLDVLEERLSQVSSEMMDLASDVDNVCKLISGPHVDADCKTRQAKEVPHE